MSITEILNTDPMSRISTQHEQNWQRHSINALLATHRDKFGVFLNRVCMFSSNSWKAHLAAAALILPMLSSAEVVYHANAGDCLSGIVKAHYGAGIDYQFVVDANPSIEDADRIQPGQPIALPNLDVGALKGRIDQTGCNAAANARGAARPIEPGATSSTAPAANKPTSNAILTGTTPRPIDVTNRTLPQRPMGEPTRVAPPWPHAPRFAIDARSENERQVRRSSNPNRYVVNAIGARTITAATALVQHPDRHFYVATRAEWQTAARDAQQKQTNTTEPPTALQRALADGRAATETHRAGNIFVDEALLRKTATQTGDNP